MSRQKKVLAQWRRWPAVSDDLAVGGPGSTSVLTTELEQEAAEFRHLSHELESCQRELAAVDRVVGGGILSAADAPISALNAEHAMDEAAVAMRQAHEQCHQLSSALSRAADQYEGVEHGIGVLGQHLAAHLGYLLGRAAPLLLWVLLPGALAVAGGVTLALAALPSDKRAEFLGSMGSWFRENSAFLTDPRVTSAVRLSVMSADDVGAGVAGIPPQVAAALGDEGLGVFGLDTSALLLMGAGGSLGLLREAPVRVTAGETTQGGNPAQSVRARLERIPTGPEQIRIDRISSPGTEDRFEVYIGGTETFAPVAGTEPFDLTSNIASVAGGNDGSAAASYRAVEEAMRLAGIDSTSHVELCGYSQGGLLAAQLAASGQYRVDSLLTVAAPAGQVEVPHTIPYLAIEHSDDLVPALGGFYSFSDPVVVSRRVFDEPPAADLPVMPAHRLPRYLDTATLIDESENVRLQQALQRMAHSGSGSVTSTVYFAERVAP